MNNTTANPSAIAFAFVIAISACHSPPSVTTTPLGAEKSYPATPDSVPIVLYTVTKPECPYEEIAALTAEGDEGSETAIVAALRQKARQLGGHAIIGYTQAKRSSSKQVLDISVRSGTAVRFRSADCMK